MTYKLYNSIAEYFKSSNCPVLREVAYIMNDDKLDTEFYYDIISIECSEEHSLVTLALTTLVDTGIENAIIKIDNNRLYWKPLGIHLWRINNNAITSNEFTINLNCSTLYGYTDIMKDAVVDSNLEN